MFSKIISFEQFYFLHKNKLLLKTGLLLLF